MSSRKPEPPIPTIPSGYVRMSSRQGTTRRVSRPPSPALHQYPPQSPLYHDASLRHPEGQTMLDRRNPPNASFVPSDELQPHQGPSGYAQSDQHSYDQDPRVYPQYAQSQSRAPYVEIDGMNRPSSRSSHLDHHRQQYSTQPLHHPHHHLQQQRPPSGGPPPPPPSHSSHPAHPSHSHHPEHSDALPSSAPSSYRLHDAGRLAIPHQHSQPLPHHRHHLEQRPQQHQHHNQHHEQQRLPPQLLSQQQQQRTRVQPQLRSSRPSTPMHTGTDTNAHTGIHSDTHTAAHAPTPASVHAHASPTGVTRDIDDSGRSNGAGPNVARGTASTGSGSGGSAMSQSIVSKSHFIRHRVAANTIGAIPGLQSGPTQATMTDMKGNSRGVNQEGRVEGRASGKTGMTGNARSGMKSGMASGDAGAMAMPPPGALKPNQTSTTSSASTSTSALPASVTSLLTEYDRLLHLFHSRSAADTTTTAPHSSAGGAADEDGGEQQSMAEAEEEGSSKLFGTRGLRRSTTRRGAGTGVGGGEAGEGGEGISADAAVKALVAKLYRQLRVQRGACDEMRTALRTVRGACERTARDAARGAWGAREKKDRESEEIFRKIHGCAVEAAEVCRDHEVEQERGADGKARASDKNAEEEYEFEGDAGGTDDANASNGAAVGGRPGSAWGEGGARPTSRGAPPAHGSQESSDKVAAVRAQLMFLLAQRDRTIASLEVRVEELLRERDARPRVDATLGLRGDVSAASGAGASGSRGVGDVVVGAGSGELGLPAPILAQFYEQYARLRSDIQSKLNERMSHLLLSSRVPRQALHLINTLHYGLVHEVAAHTTTKAVYNARLLQLERLAREREVDVRLGRMREEALEQALRERDAVIRKAEKSLFMTLQRQKTHSTGSGAGGSG